MTTDDYLWDRTGAPDEVIVQLERALARRRFDPAAQPMPRVSDERCASPPRAARVLHPRVVTYAAAASLALALVGGLGVWGYLWRLTWAADRPWPVVTPSGQMSWLAVGTSLSSPVAGSAEVAVARIGRMTVHPASDVMLEATSSSRHVVRLARGGVSVRVFAPPGRFRLQTPAGLVTDLGCVFEATVDASARTRVRVRSGWVELENVHGAVLVPAGATSDMAPDRPPSTPVFDDADPAFAAAVRHVEQGASTSAAAGLSTARVGDVASLLVLARRLEGDDRARVIAQAARLHAPPPGVTAQAVSAGDDAALWRWFDALPLPPPKQWWRNWRDAWSSDPRAPSAP